MPRTFEVPRQRAEVWIVDVATGASRLVLTARDRLVEAPSWTPDGRWLVVNGDGRLFRVPAALGGGTDADLVEIDLGGLPPVNNDHVLAPDGRTAYVSCEDGHLYAVPLDAACDRSGVPRRVSEDRGEDFAHYLHGVSPDGATLAYVGMRRLPDGVRTDIHLVPVEGGDVVALTDDEHADDGCEFSADGAWVWFSSEREADVPGHAQLFRVPAAGGTPECMTHGERVDWFPHPAPDGRVAYVSFPPGTLGHPADVDVLVRLREVDGTVRDLAAVHGGQGTMNVPSWSPDGSHLAYVAYPVEA
ncbi:WD40 repeat protein [Sediminihabitans luteus]|uniref:WD40 repeat protein n=1 Tax=Sediminihabitans luteus TaxID=1138585 RepID=A0A2M9CEQ2_9CELL|nr:PD40 domain-containing protein [Sediminihabitans luteus]PJJ70342.1 WD40 repeat protein [Sediminihabitans luteus]GII97814.1 hypothetical protein Slu03_01920 [Sediminihabitans luteus]